MDFEKINKMIDELDKNFDIVEAETKKIEEQNHENGIALFKEVREYFKNWAHLFEKVHLSGCRSIIVRVSAEAHEFTVSIILNKGFPSDLRFMRYGSRALTKEISCDLSDNPNALWYSHTYYTDRKFDQVVVPAIKAIDYDYLEKALSDELSKMIERKAKKLEEAYHKAIKEA